MQLLTVLVTRNKLASSAWLIRTFLLICDFISTRTFLFDHTFFLKIFRSKIEIFYLTVAHNLLLVVPCGLTVTRREAEPMCDGPIGQSLTTWAGACGGPHLVGRCGSRQWWHRYRLHVGVALAVCCSCVVVSITMGAVLVRGVIGTAH